MRVLLSVALSLAICNPLLACPKKVQVLEEGAKSPCKGFLFSPEKEEEVRLKVLKYGVKEEEIRIKDKQIQLYRSNEELLLDMLDQSEEKSKLWQETAVKNTETLVKLEQRQGTRDWIFFVTGILTTVAAGYAVGQAAK